MAKITISVHAKEVNTEYREKLTRRIAENVHVDDDPDFEVLQHIVNGATEVSNNLTGDNDAGGSLIVTLDWKTIYNAYIDELGLA